MAEKVGAKTLQQTKVSAAPQMLSVAQHLAEEEAEYCFSYCSFCSSFHFPLKGKRMVWINTLIAFTTILSIKSVNLAL